MDPRHAGALLLGSARRVFEAFEAQESGKRPAPVAPEIRGLLDHFEVRRRYEARDFSQFDTPALIRYREDKRRYADARFEALYERWKASGAGAVLELLQPGQSVKDVPAERFSTCVLEYDYDLFGTLTKGNEPASDQTQTQTQP